MPGAVQVVAREKHFPRNLTLLIVDQDRFVRQVSRQLAESMGYSVLLAENAASAMRQLALQPIDLVMLDVLVPGVDGLDLLQAIIGRKPDAEIVMLSGHTTLDYVLTAMKKGATDYLKKPLDVHDLKALLQRVSVQFHTAEEDRKLHAVLQHDPGLGELVGKSPEMCKLFSIIMKVAASRHPVLILGESGTGKEKFARAIHNLGHRPGRPFVVLDCKASSPEAIELELFGRPKGGQYPAKQGAITAANGGTLFIDSISDLPLALQGKLLRVLQERTVKSAVNSRAIPVDLRLIAAAQPNLEAAVQQAVFRRDLFLRLNVVSLQIPPLRERKDDIRLLARHVLERISNLKAVQYSLDPEALKLLLAYRWPDNVRELENCLERAVAVSSGPVLQVCDLPPEISHSNGHGGYDQSGSKIVPLAELEKQAILQTLEHLKGDKLTTARVLGIGKTTLYRKLKEYGITELSMGQAAGS